MDERRLRPRASDRTEEKGRETRKRRKDSRNGKILVELGSSGELLDGGLVLAEGGVDEADVGEDPAGVGDLGEELQALLKVFLVVGLEGGGPSLELSLERHEGGWVERGEVERLGWAGAGDESD